MYAKRRSGAFASVAERNQHSQESGGPFSHIDADRGVDKKALRLAEGAARPGSPALFPLRKEAFHGPKASLLCGMQVMAMMRSSTT